MNTETTYDFSMGSVPDSWHDAADEAPEHDLSPLRKKRSMLVMPAGEKLDMTTAFIAGGTLAFLSGLAWYLFETRYITGTPLLAVVSAIVIALAVRLGGTAAEREVRATIASVFYMVTVLLTVYMIERTEFRAAYGVSPDLVQSEQAFVRDRLTEPDTVLAWVAGLVLCMQISYLTGRRPRRQSV
ncbi:MAG: hypothetical protein ACRBI6_00170 [Acidimicrobiales bacterium]